MDEKYEGDAKKLELNTDAYNISKDAIHFGEDDYFSSPERAAHYDFCTVVEGVPCSILTIHTSASGFYGVSEDYYQIPYGHCNDSVTVSDEAQASMSVPPVPLTENYLECHRTLTDTLLTSVGIAVGNVLSVRSALVIFFSFLLARYTSSGAASRSGTAHRNPTSQYVTYGSIERDKVLQYLAFNLLLARDGKYRGPKRHDASLESGTYSEDSPLANLAKELEAHPTVRRFFPLDGDATSTYAQSNPLQAGDNAGDVELKGGFKSSADSSSTDSSTLPMPKRSQFRKRTEKAFVEEVLHNPMYLSEMERGKDGGKRKDRRLPPR